MKINKTTRTTLISCMVTAALGFSACGGEEPTSAQVSNAHMAPDSMKEESNLIEGLSDEQLGELVDELTELGICNTTEGALVCGDEMLSIEDLRRPGADGQDGQDGEPGKDGSDGQDGQDGNDGRGVQIVTSPEAPGSQCPYGGTKIEFVLEGADAASATTYQCDQPTRCQPGYLFEEASTRCIEAAGVELVGTISEIDNNHVWPIGYLPVDLMVGEPCRLLVTYPVRAESDRFTLGDGYVKLWNFGQASLEYGLSLSIRDGLYNWERIEEANQADHARIAVQISADQNIVSVQTSGVVPNVGVESSRLGLTADLARGQDRFDLPTDLAAWQSVVAANPALEAELETYSDAGTGQVRCHVTSVEPIW